MPNMFANNDEKQIPKNFNDCLKSSGTVSNLHSWAENLERLGKIFCVIVIVLGLIASYSSATVTQEVTHGTYYQYTETETKFDNNIFISGIIDTIVQAYLAYCVHHAVALIISALALITQNTTITANIKLYEQIKSGEINKDLNETLSTTPGTSILPTNVSIEEFKHHVSKLSIKDLKNIASTQHSLYTQEQYSIIKDTMLNKLSNKDDQSTTHHCPVCNTNNPSHRHYCIACGAKLPD